MSASDFKLEEGLLDAEVYGGPWYSVTHEASGWRLGKPTTNQWHALAAVAVLISRPIDWTKDADGVCAQVRAADEVTRSIIGAIQSGTVQFQEMGQA